MWRYLQSCNVLNVKQVEINQYSCDVKGKTAVNYTLPIE